MPMTMMFSFFALAVWFGSVLLTDPTYINSFTGKHRESIYFANP